MSREKSVELHKVFTSGEWSYSGFDVIHTSPDGHTGYIASPSLRGKSTWEAEANAKLIAAAPDLLDALQQIVDSADDESCDGMHCIDSATLFAAVAAIKKAHGR